MRGVSPSLSKKVSCDTEILPEGARETGWKPLTRQGVPGEDQPLMTPTGRNLATFLEMPTLSTTSTT